MEKPAEHKGGMDRGSYIAANGMIAQQKRLDVLANNLANVNTRGFKADRLTFRDMMLRTVADDGGYGNPVAQLSSGPTVDAGREVTDLRPGDAEHTGNPLDLRIGGDTTAMFAVAHKGGTRYTRDGTFALNAKGGLVTKAGDAVLDPSGRPIRGLAQPLTSGPEGLLAAGKPVEIGRFVGKFEKDGDGAGLFTATDARADNTVSIVSGELETANFNPVSAMMDMIALQRAYEIAQKMVQSQDESTAKLAETMS